MATKIIVNPQLPRTGRLGIVKVKGDKVFYMQGQIMNESKEIEWRREGKVYEATINEFRFMFNYEGEL